jgi:hypothetical protein
MSSTWTRAIIAGAATLLLVGMTPAIASAAAGWSTGSPMSFERTA